MDTKAIIENNEALYGRIDKCIDDIVSARLSRDEKKEGRSLFCMESLMVATQQHLSYINDCFNKEDVIVNRKLDKIKEILDNTCDLAASVDAIKLLLSWK